jgi:hypothetical protein
MRMLVLTVLVVMVMQIKIGPQKTLDDHFEGWLKNSVAVDYIQEAIDGGVALTKAGYKKADDGVHAVLAKMSHRHKKEGRSLFSGLKLKRYDDRADDDDSYGENTNAPRASIHAGQAH